MNVYHYVTRLPEGFNEAVMVCSVGYTVYTDSSLSREEMLKAFLHALEHIKNNDFDEYGSADSIEWRAHEGQ